MLNTVMTINKALAAGMEIENIPDDTNFFDEFYSRLQQSIAIFCSDKSIIFMDRDKMAVMNSKRAFASHCIKSKEDQESLANFEPFSEVISYCAKNDITLKKVMYGYRIKRLDHEVMGKNVTLLEIKRRIKYLLYKENGQYVLHFFNLYTHNKPLPKELER
jgi:hypothetical protein